MQLLVLRHGPAMDRDAFARSHDDDDLRPLTDDGVQQVRRVARGIRSLTPTLDQVWTSPLVRAVQTAEVLCKSFGLAPAAQVSALSPEQPVEALAAELADQPRDAVIAVVGHRPDLDILITWLIAGVGVPGVRLTKAGCAWIEFSGRVGPARGELRWLLTARQARRLRKQS